MFNTQFDFRLRSICPSGSPIKQLYKGHVNDDGIIELVDAGTVDLYDEIQSHKDSCDINVLLKRYVNGETDILSQVQGVYADSVGMPKTYAELLNSVIQGEEMFNSLPVETKEKFGFSFTQFMASMDNLDDFRRKLGFTSDTSVSDVKDVIKEDVKNEPEH